MKPHLGFHLIFAVVSFILFFRLGAFGIFEPFETARAEQVDQIQSGGDVRTFPLLVEERLAGLWGSDTSPSEFVLRVPSAIFALLSLILIYLFVGFAAGWGFAATAALMLCGSSFFWFHGRQLTSVMPSAFAEIAALGGGLLAVLADSKRQRVFGLFALVLGIGLQTACRGLMIGAVPPLLSVSFAALSSGLFSKGDSSRSARRILIIAASAGGVLAASIFAGTVLFSPSDVPFITGRETNTPVSKHTFEFAFEQIVYGFFPLVALVPSAVSPIFRFGTDEPEGRAFLRIFAVYALLFEYAAQVVSLKVNGMQFAPTVLPMAVLIAFAVDDLLNAAEPGRLEVFISAALLAVLIRDFAQNNQTLYYAYGVGELGIPKDHVKPVIAAGLFSIPTALLIVYGFLQRRLRIRPASIALKALAPLTFAGFIAFFLVPDAAQFLSSKHGANMAEKYRANNEPLAVMGKGVVAKNSKKLSDVKELTEWLSRSDRVFALFPPKELPVLDRSLRERAGRQAFVLERAADRFMLAVSTPLPGEKNASPLLGVVQSEPFTPSPPNAKEVNFGDVLTLLGWQLESEGDIHRLTRGEDLIFTSYWRVDGKLTSDYKMFMHIDGPGGRLHGDHPMFGGSFPTSTWQKGDYIKEVFRVQVPSYQGKGEYEVRMGMYNDGGRLSVKDDPRAKENSLHIGNTVIE